MSYISIALRPCGRDADTRERADGRSLQPGVRLAPRRVGPGLVAPRILLRAVRHAREAAVSRRAELAAASGAAVRRPAAAGVALPVPLESTIDAARGAALAVLSDVHAHPSPCALRGGASARFVDPVAQ